MKRFLSLGAGVQSTYIALREAREGWLGIDAAIFADTGSEPPSVYRHLEALIPQLPFPVHCVVGYRSGERLRESIMSRVSQAKSGSGGPPFFTTTTGRDHGMLPRQCTHDFKLAPLAKKQRELLGLKRGRRPEGILAEVILGISADEALRMKPNHLPYLRNVFPLVERGITRGHCLEWFKKNGLPTPPKSACTYCPYRSDRAWKDLRDNEPEAFADAVRMDEAIRDGYRGSTEKLYVHRSLTPLSEADFRTAEDFGQMDFINECEGLCEV
jgi:hypothetical protein